MLSNKWTFSLTSLVVMLALCFVASSAMAQFEIGLSVDDDVDVSYADGNHVVYGVATTIRMLSPKVVNFDQQQMLQVLLVLTDAVCCFRYCIRRR